MCQFKHFTTLLQMHSARVGLDLKTWYRMTTNVRARGLVHVESINFWSTLTQRPGWRRFAHRDLSSRQKRIPVELSRNWHRLFGRWNAPEKRLVRKPSFSRRLNRAGMSREQRWSVPKYFHYCRVTNQDLQSNSIDTYF